LSKLFTDDTKLIFSGATLNVVNITNKRVVIPKSILINNQTINVVDKFRLLGVLVDNK